MFCLVTVYALNQEGKLVRREIKDGMYSSHAYFVVQSAIQAPAILVLSLFAAFPAACENNRIQTHARPEANLRRGRTHACLHHSAACVRLVL